MKNKTVFNHQTPEEPGGSSTGNPSQQNHQVDGSERRGRKRGSGEQILHTAYHGAAYKFFKQQQWDVWYEEFVQSANPDGSLKYPTAGTLAQEKGKTFKERKWIRAAIGPKPVLEGKRKNPIIPWLGDWQQRRIQGSWFGTEKALALSTVIEERRNGLEAARAAAELDVEWLERLTGLAHQLDNYYLGQAFLPSLSYQENAKRMKDYLKHLSVIFQMHHTATVDYLHCHGVHRDHVSILAEMTLVSIVARADAQETGLKSVDHLEKELKEIATQYKAAKLQERLQAAEEGKPVNDNPIRNKVAFDMSDMIVRKAELFKMPLPGGEITLPEADLEDAGAMTDAPGQTESVDSSEPEE
jgi:hypothetical protein